MLIDAANDAATVALADRESAGLARVATTHQHGDHWQALASVVAATSARTTAGADDVSGIPVPTDEPLVDGATVPVGDCSLEAIHLVGHTPGSIAYLYEDPDGIAHVFTGDSLFPGGVGNTRGNKANFESCSAMWSGSCSTGCRTRPGCTPGTATTRRWAPSALRFRSGAPAVGSVARW